MRRYFSWLGSAEAYQGVMNVKLPKGTVEQKAARAEALEHATRIATEVPLRTARHAGEVLDQLAQLVEFGNQNAQSDAATGAQLSYAALKGAQYNVIINLAGIADREFADVCRREVNALALKGQEILQKIDHLLLT
jgi:glutamate formiminotransferase/formiminotetrahydrofolate cyclodeaminase